MLFEHACEVLGVVEAKVLGRGGDACAADELLLRLCHDEPADDIAGGVAGDLAYEVAEVVGREEEFLGAVLHRRQAQRQLQDTHFSPYSVFLVKQSVFLLTCRLKFRRTFAAMIRMTNEKVKSEKVKSEK